ncbi:unnamed protein product, partial [Cylindrotheca closterium]
MDLTQKARICAQGDQTDPPLLVTYASVVTRESICIGFLLALLNGLDILSADIAGAYLNAPCAERIYRVLGPEFGDLEGRTAVVEKALDGLKSSGFSWRSTLSKTLREEMEFEQCCGDMDVWRKPALKSNGKKYYKYIFVYTDDLMAVSEILVLYWRSLERITCSSLIHLQSLQRSLVQQIQNGLLMLVILENAGSAIYLLEALCVVKSRISPQKYNSAALPSGYKPELHNTDFVDAETHTLYMQLIGILRWLVELGRMDLCAEVSMMSLYNAMPCVGHFHAVLHL